MFDEDKIESEIIQTRGGCTRGREDHEQRSCGTACAPEHVVELEEASI
jgi:hypothetical protein